MRSTNQQIKQELADNKALELCARQCGVIGDVTKLKICYLLRYHPELNVTTIAELVGTSVSNASHSLSKLRAVNLVKTRKEARTVYYSLEENAFDNVMTMIGGRHARE
ncbi:MAG TPA: metalloregulator ArsR/SmtB family transcription factor [Candidatus Limnocylindrales bacterium]|nr:metalloregulator ArsR/SmtB family transcription factor [Candidatus Limnocylindrales bacterium]